MGENTLAAKDRKGMNRQAVAALVLGILAFIPIVGIIPGIFAIILGRKAQNRIKVTQENGAGLAYAGWIFGMVAVIAYGVILLFRLIASF